MRQSNCNGRIYKGTPYEITVPINDGELDNFSLSFYTDGDDFVQFGLDDVVVSGGTVYVDICEHTFDLINEGVIKYDLEYSIDGTDYQTHANTLLYLKNVDGYSGHTAEEYYQSGYTAGAMDGNIGFQSGYTAGMEAQKALIEELDATANGTYTSENGFSPVIVNVPGSACKMEEKDYYIDKNGKINIEPDSGYDGINSGSITVAVPQTGHTDAELKEAYTSGYTGGKADQKALMTQITATTNGTYTREDGYSSINVNVAQSGHTDAELEAAYTSGYTGGEIAGAEAQKALMIPITATTNGTYSREDGYSSVNVNVAQTGHTDAELETAYNSGYTAGMAAQKALMVGLTATTNGTYAREDGYSSVYVNVSGSSSGTPSGVTVDDEFYFEARENNSKLTIASNIAYSTDKTTWNTDGFETTLTLNSGEKVYLKALSGFTISQIWPTFPTTAGTFNIGGKIGYFVFGDSVDGHALTSSIASLFAGSTGIVDASNLKLNVDFWTNNIQGAFGHMFFNCSSLINTPLLTATTLTNGCYGGMFEGCNSLQTAPALPATTLAEGCYGNMFCDCVSLVTAPALPATTLAEGCYKWMFMRCTALHTAPALPATTLFYDCYYGMFYGCSSLTTPPTLPATTLVSMCYGAMFMGCTSLTTAPELPASTLVYDCYYEMFYDCSNLSSVKVLANMWETYKYSRGWLTRVASAGTFTKLESTYIQTDESGIPSGWTVVNI